MGRWLPGQSGNILGAAAPRRPPQKKPISAALRKFMNVSPEKLSCKPGDSVLTCFVKVNWQLSLRGNQRAIQFIADRIEGPAVVSNGDNGEVVERIEGTRGNDGLCETIAAIYGIRIRDGREVKQLPEGESDDESA
jgi:hypothetical protein